MDPLGFQLVLMDTATAATLAQVLPVLLLTLAVEVRRNELHREFSTTKLRLFFLTFGVIETLLVLSIDGSIFPFQWFDACSALLIFAIMGLLSHLALSDPPRGDRMPG